ncbi:hypothetical protein SSABA_v1c01040 [Spiroplasma sabaudiense Ar-1343]|uniref:Uncharacterized protein n=1 Tax=Spiroplasma sabaudiense Ar-1343 TaxID=1276257 RepID=W6A967_9MOLU|nr:hypothetical protein SSABA_v1c01040 [Spiroplasma sabaudiense Ar-1343]
MWIVVRQQLTETQSVDSVLKNFYSNAFELQRSFYNLD